MGGHYNSDLALFHRGYVDDNGSLVYTANHIIPIEYVRGGLYYFNVVVPFTTQRYLLMQFRAQLRDRVIQRDGMVVAQHNKLVVESSPYNVTEISREEGRDMIVPNIQSISIKRNTYSPSNIVHRMRKLGFQFDLSQFQVEEDGEWLTYRHQWVGCDSWFESDLPPSAFEPEKPSDSGDDDSEISEAVSPKSTGSKTKVNTSSTGSSSSSSTSSSSGVKKRSDGSTTDSLAIEVTNTSDRQENQRSQQQTSTTGTAGSDNGNYAVRSYYIDSNGIVHNSYQTYNAKTNSWKSVDRPPAGYSVVEDTPAVRESIVQRANSTSVGQSTSSGSSHSSNSSSSASSSSSGSSGYHYTGGAHSWGSGQTSATYTDSNGGQHTIYR